MSSLISGHSLGIPNFWNVVLNFLFIAVGAVGLWQFHRDPAIVVLFLGILLTGFGSAYYHLDPNDRTLFWEQAADGDQLHGHFSQLRSKSEWTKKREPFCLWPLIAVGVLSLLLWRWTGDLRLYGWVQFFPCLALPLLFLLFPPKHSATSYWFIAAALYTIAKLFEFYDNAIYSVGSILSGHTLQAYRRGRRMCRSPATFREASTDYDRMTCAIAEAPGIALSGLSQDVEPPRIYLP